MAELMELPRLRAVLEEYGQAVAQQYKDNLVRDGRPASGDLIRNITTFVEVNGQGYEVKMSLNDYWKYIEYGTKGWLTGNTSRKFPPPAAIEHWIQVKPGLPKPATIRERKSLAYLIGRKIRDFGTKGRADLTEAKMTITEQYRERIAEALGADMVNYIRKVIAPQ